MNARRRGWHDRTAAIRRAAMWLGITTPLWTAPASAAPRLTLAQLLGAPLAPGAVVRLVPYRNQPGVLERWQTALGADEPRTRAAAARAITAAGAVELTRELVIALESEADIDAQVELIRSLFVFGSADTEAVLLRTLGERPPPVRADVMVIVAQRRSTEALALLGGELFDRLTLSDAAVARFLLAATASSSRGPSRAYARVLELEDVRLFDLLEPLMRERASGIASDLMAATFASESPELRKRVAWYLIEHHAVDPPPAPGDLLAAIPRTPGGAERDDEELLALELLRRAVGLPAAARVDQAERIEAIDGPLPRPKGADVLRLLTPEETAALDRRRDRAGGEPSRPAESGADRRASERPEPGDPALLRQLTAYPAGFVGSVLDACGCAPKVDDLVAAHIRWGNGPRPRRVELTSWPDRDGCEEAARLLAMTAMPGDDWRLEGHRPQLAVVFVHAEAIACAEAHRRARDPVYPADTIGLAPPQAVERVPTEYPERLKKAKIAGRAAVRAVVSADGCPTELAAFIGDEPGLQLATARALVRWRFEPARIDDEAVATDFSMVGNFTLR